MLKDYFKFHRLRLHLAFLSMIVGGLTSCAATRVTTSTQTAVEQALVSQAFSRGVQDLKLTANQGQSFFIEDSHLPREICGSATCLSNQSSLVHQLLIEQFTSFGYRYSESKEGADILILPRLEYAAVDDSDSLIGIPGIPIPVPGVGTIQTPALALFSSNQQYGRVKIGVTALDARTGEQIFAQTLEPEQTYYKRWVLLLVLGWRTTNLDGEF